MTIDTVMYYQMLWLVALDFVDVSFLFRFVQGNRNSCEHLAQDGSPPANSHVITCNAVANGSTLQECSVAGVWRFIWNGLKQPNTILKAGNVILFNDDNIGFPIEGLGFGKLISSSV